MKDVVRIAFTNLTHRKKRAWLTVIGIFIGIMAVVALVSLGRGLEAGVDAQFSKLGVDKIFIQPSSGFGGASGGVSTQPIGERELDRARTVPGVVEATGTNFRSARIDWGDTTVFQTVTEVPDNSRERDLLLEAFTAQDIAEGRHLETGDANKAVIGSRFTDREKYRDALAVGRTITVNNVSHTIVGILERTGDPGTDESVFLAGRTYADVVPTAEDEYDIIVVRVARGEEPVTVAERLEQSIRRLRDQKEGEEDFTVQTTDDIRESFNTILAIIQYTLTGIALISLLVGAIGIMNTMYTAVLERTKEIGIMKAIGARNEDIRAIFLIESGLLGVGGGAVGVVLGLGVSFAASRIASAALGTDIIQFYASWWLVLGALLFSFLVGSLAGYLPARAAAAQRPVDSLRYE